MGRVVTAAHDAPERSAERLAANKAIVVEFFAAISDGRFDRAAELTDPDGTWVVPRRRETLTLATQLDKMRKRPGITFRVDLMTAEDDRVAALVEGDVPEPDGRFYEKFYNVLVLIAEGRIAHVWMYDDGGMAERITHTDHRN